MRTLLVVLVHHTFVMSFACDGWRDYYCAAALAKGHYEKCSKVIDDFPDDQFVCEMRDCDDLRHINMHRGISSEVS